MALKRKRGQEPTRGDLSSVGTDPEVTRAVLPSGAEAAAQSSTDEAGYTKLSLWHLQLFQWHVKLPWWEVQLRNELFFPNT